MAESLADAFITEAFQAAHDYPGHYEPARPTTLDEMLAATDVLLEFAVAGKARHPIDTERLMEYWAHGEGAAKIRWGEPHDFYRCEAHLGKYVGPNMLKGLCANLHHRAIGVWPGQEDKH